MKKKILALCLVVVLAVTAVTGATLAYFTDTESKTNTMVIGNVQIDIEEWSSVNGEWDDFDNDEFVLYPMDDVQGDALTNKLVGTFNTSPSGDAAYIRTIVLIEANDQMLTRGDECCFPGIHFGFNDTTNGTAHGAKVETTLDETVNVGGEEYWVVSFVAADEKAIPVNEYLYNLSEVWMDKDVTSQQIAGWGEDGKVNVIVYAQGIQEESLSHAAAMEALGEVDADFVKGLTIANDATINNIIKFKKPAADDSE